MTSTLKCKRGRRGAFFLPRFLSFRTPHVFGRISSLPFAGCIFGYRIGMSRRRTRRTYRRVPPHPTAGSTRTTVHHTCVRIASCHLRWRRAFTTTRKRRGESGITSSFWGESASLLLFYHYDRSEIQCGIVFEHPIIVCGGDVWGGIPFRVLSRRPRKSVLRRKEGRQRCLWVWWWFLFGVLPPMLTLSPFLRRGGPVVLARCGRHCPVWRRETHWYACWGARRPHPTPLTPHRLLHRLFASLPRAAPSFVLPHRQLKFLLFVFIHIQRGGKGGKGVGVGYLGHNGEGGRGVWRCRYRRSTPHWGGGGWAPRKWGRPVAFDTLQR